MRDLSFQSREPPGRPERVSSAVPQTISIPVRRRKKRSRTIALRTCFPIVRRLHRSRFSGGLFMTEFGRSARILLMGASALLGCSAATAADYPDHNITLIVPFAPGGTSDVVARLVGEHMAKTLGQSIIVQNDAGAGGTVAGRRFAQAAADDYTLIIGTLGTHGAAPCQYPNLKYDPRRDFTPIGATSEMPFVLVTRKDFPANNLKEFVEYVQRNQHKVS